MDEGADSSSVGIYANKLIAKDSVLDVKAMNAPGGTSIGIYATELFQAENTEIEVKSGNAKESCAIKARQMFTLDDVHLIADAGEAEEGTAGIHLLSGTTATVKNSGIEATADRGDNSYGIYAYAGADLAPIAVTLTDSIIDATGGDTNTDEDVNYSYSDGIFVNSIKGTDSQIFATGGNSVQSDGIFADTILLNGGFIQATADENSAYSYGVYLYDDPSFTLIGADVIASGATQNVFVHAAYADAFQGIVYKADENAAPRTVTDLAGFDGYFGNPHKLTYHANGVDAEMPETEIYYNGQFIEITDAIPTAEGYTFLGWSEDPDAIIPEHEAGADSSTSMGEEDMTLYAIWQCNGGKGCILESFGDLAPTEWYHDGIHFCLDASIMKGMSKTAFAPDLAASRAMIVTTLYRLAGEPKVTAKNAFDDVPEDEWYTDAVIWAAEEGIVEGYPDGSFAPDQAATREELATILYRYCGDGDDETEIPASYADKAKVSDWAAEAMAWAIDAEIINGITDTTLAPKANATRAQLATILRRTAINVIIGEE